MLDLRRRYEKLRDPSLTALLLAQVFVIFVARPLASSGVTIPPLVVAFVTGVLLAVIFLVAPSTAATTTVFVLVALSWATEEARQQYPSILTVSLAATTGVLAWSAACAVVVFAVFGPGRVTYHRIEGAIVLYLALALIFTELYRVLDYVAADAFRGAPRETDEASIATMMYFSLTTMTSTGFGDIVPVHPFARSLANLEAVVGQLYPATVLARLITLQLADRDR